MKFAMTTMALFCLAAALGGPAPASAQSSDLSPVLLIETGPSDNPDYRRMVFVKYLDGETVSVAYKAYNRSEFIQIDDTTPDSLVGACATGQAATLDEIRTFEAAERQAKAAGADPMIAHFCIKDITGWEAGNRVAYLDPIFNDMPHAASLNN
ncbi:hypothetical protein [uncultured Algimonas sp.]|uniref:hypothetical protein n=1 Tax=uncultured Algimonas sp. TaxID=1547920 RepID=UPI0026222E52|nr:hypothetical protein [uncultured Algimonas sp.]